MGKDARSCWIYTWGMGKYVNIPWWSPCLHWLPVRSRRVCAFLFSDRMGGANIFASRMKALLFTLIRAFEFELAVPAEDVAKKTGIFQRPVLLSNPAAGNQMPLLLKPVNPI